MENHCPLPNKNVSDTEEDADEELSTCEDLDLQELESFRTGASGSARGSYAFSDVCGSGSEDEEEVQLPALSEKDLASSEAVEQLIQQYTLTGNVSINETGVETRSILLPASNRVPEPESDIDSNLTDAEELEINDSDAYEDVEEEEEGERDNLPSTSRAAYFCENTTNNTVTISVSEKNPVNNPRRRSSQDTIGLEMHADVEDLGGYVDPPEIETHYYLTIPEHPMDPSTDEEVVDNEEEKDSGGLTDCEDFHDSLSDGEVVGTNGGMTVESSRACTVGERVTRRSSQGKREMVTECKTLHGLAPGLYSEEDGLTDVEDLSGMEADYLAMVEEEAQSEPITLKPHDSSYVSVINSEKLENVFGTPEPGDGHLNDITEESNSVPEPPSPSS